MMKKTIPAVTVISESASEDDSAIRRYMTRTVLAVLCGASSIVFIFSLAGWFIGHIPLDTVLISLAFTLSFILGILLNRSFPLAGSALPPAIMFFAAAYGNWVGGIDAPAMILYTITIVLAALLMGLREMYIGLALSVVAYTSLAFAHRLGYITHIRTSETVFFNRVLITIAAIIGMSFLVRLMIILFQGALEESKKRLAEIQQLAQTNSYLYDQARMEIEERKSAEEALRDSEAKYRELVQNANSIIMRLDIEGRITFFNEYAERLFGFTSAEITGRPVMETIVPPRDSSDRDLHDMIRGILTDPLAYEKNENENITRDGRRLWIAWGNRPIYDSDGRLKEVLCVGNDVTERRQVQEEKDRMQAQLFQAQKMEAVGTLTSGIAHDFNNVLAGIMGSLSLLNIILADENLKERKEVEENLRIAMDASDRAADMIRKLLTISRKGDLALRPVDLNSVIKSVADVCSNSFPKCVTIDTVLSPAGSFVMADQAMIEQVVLNLMVNACHAMTLMRPRGEKEGGTVQVTVRETDDLPPAMLREGGNPYLSITVTDTGVGMDAETRERIFEPFFSTKKKGEGTGLGLAMVYSIVTRLEGYIDVASTMGEGTRITVFLPAFTGEEAVSGTAQHGRILASGRGTILAIDDEKAVLKVAEKILKSSGYSVITADNGEDGLRIFRETGDGISLVLLDVSMPGMSGPETHDAIRTINGNVPIIMSSGFPHDDRITSRTADGRTAFLEKPYTAPALASRVREMLNRHGGNAS